MDFSKLTLGDKILGGCALVLVIDLLFLPWHHWSYSYSSGDIHVGGSFSRTAIQSPNSFWGWLAMLVLLAIIGVTIVRRFTDTALPDTPRPLPELTFYATIAVFVLLFLKLILKFDYIGFGAYLAILLAGGMVYGAYLDRNEEEGAPSVGTGDGGTATPF
ncbi:hypothetical protein [Aquihabitans sp. McL0605]|uniref:hypothetical protein n=1 Tax=Aquihabitans sp. McL0605 TaxID=3415671 RepID=UPI003CECDBE9